MACVDLPAFPLQLLLARQPDWAEHPAAVVDRDRPLGVIRWVNRKARRCGVLPGMRYAAGLALARDLRAGEISPAEIAAGVSALTARLRRFSPEVEPAEQPGVFWLDASGLEPLFPSLSEWAENCRHDLRQAGFYAAVAVGFTRFGTFAVARSGNGVTSGGTDPGSVSDRRARGRVTVFRDPAEERRTAARVPLGSLDLEPGLYDVLRKLGVRTVGAFVRLPAAGLRRRFGPEAYRLHQLAAGDLTLPLQPQPAPEPLNRRVDLDFAETDVHRLLFRIKQELGPLLALLAARWEGLTELRLRLEMEGRVGQAGAERHERIRTAAPTLDARQILNLVLLRFEGGELPAGVVAFDLAVESARATAEQLDLYARGRQRTLAAAARALDRVRARFGDLAVVRACLEEGHLPEGRFAWRPMERLVPPSPGKVEVRPLVRRIYRRPLRLQARPRHEPDGWLLRGAERGNVVHSSGPYVLAGGWWVRPVHREYYYARTRDGGWFWVYYDVRRRRWFLHGELE